MSESLRSVLVFWMCSVGLTDHGWALSSTTGSSSSRGNGVHRVQTVSREGVTSLERQHSLEDGLYRKDDNNGNDGDHPRCFVFVGTKRGALDVYESTNDDEDGTETWHRRHRVDQIDSKTFPVYSLSLSDSLCFCGCGDRYISVLALGQTEDQTKLAKPLDQRLGPHTGWVKGLLWVETSDMLFSIGCNCIENWKLLRSQHHPTSQEDPQESYSFEQLPKRSIESSPEHGATLSSDLLCLAKYDDSDGSTVLFSGGVDGRLHVWSTEQQRQQRGPRQAIAAHDGRLNRIVVIKIPAKSSGEERPGQEQQPTHEAFLFSVGHDGTLQCRRIRRQTNVNTANDNIINSNQHVHLEESPCGSLQMTRTNSCWDDGNHGDVDTFRITALASASSFRINENGDTHRRCFGFDLVLGTSDGVVQLVRAEYNQDDDEEEPMILTVPVSDRVEISGPSSDGTSTIHSLLFLGKKNTGRKEEVKVLVGHSKGLDVVHFLLRR